MARDKPDWDELIQATLVLSAIGIAAVVAGSIWALWWVITHVRVVILD